MSSRFRIVPNSSEYLVPGNPSCPTEREEIQCSTTSWTTVINYWERELNRLVYELYGLTDEEIAIVERQR
jgi:hypothetical protein